MVVAHSYHVWSVEYEGDSCLMVLAGTRIRGKEVWVWVLFMGNLRKVGGELERLLVV